MPVSVSEIENAARPLSERILALLQAQPEQAFSLIEIWASAEGLASYGYLAFLVLDEQRRSLALASVREALTTLEAEGRVRALEYKGQPHYSWTGR